ncbi:Glutamate synthase [NADPH] large chain (EC [Olavius algarvensis Delta 1 endosymbiont]|nr:Glutamate synthase [NADPH] large chain (EC [Olavius algarvensis Delta 1 endosymbiont]
MDIDLSPYFQKYEKLVATADEVFDRVKKAHADCVKCGEQCADCCFALFDLTLIEALYIHHRFNEKFEGSAKVELLEKANRADRQTYKIKRKAFQKLQAGENEGEILGELAFERVRCPLLSEKDLCDLYDFRPLTCRFYGIPTAIGGAGHTCGKSEFKEGEQYPTVNLDTIHNQLQQISAELLRDIKSKNVKLADLLVPLSSAMVMDFDEVFLGIAEPPEEKAPPKRRSRKNR